MTSAQPHTPASERMLTMQEAMEYLSERNFPCKSRSTFYRILKEFSIPYTNVNPNGVHEIRRFPVTGLQHFLIEQGLEP